MDAGSKAKSGRRSLRLKRVGTGLDPKPVRPAGKEDYHRFLLLLDPNPRAADEKFAILRNKLILFFDCHGCPDASLQADIVIGRAAAKVSSKAIENIDGYSLAVARLRFKEILRERRREPFQADNLDQLNHEDTRSGMLLEAPDERATNEIRLECLETCMKQLRKRDQELLRDYYREQKRRKIDLREELAEKYHMSIIALRTRLCRLRKRLAQCCKDRVARNSPVILKHS
jgi:DNA-directed RNA polymerase specialized sigma24 family protein